MAGKSLLDAVNDCLRAIAEAPVSSIEDNESVDVADALLTIQDIDLKVQSEGWCFNREDRFNLTPNENSELLLPENTLRVDAAYYSSPGELDVVQRGNKLYDKISQSTVFESPVEVDLIVQLSWDDLPVPARNYIAIRAARQFQGTKQVSGTVHRITEQEETRERATLEQHEDETCDANQVSGNISLVSALYGRGVRRNRSGA